MQQKTRFNFQISNPSKYAYWDEVPFKFKYFAKREQAVALAQRAASIHKTTVRLTEGPYPFHANGTYFQA